jgi:putative flippase GtrA
LPLKALKRGVQQHQHRLRFLAAGSINTVIGVSLFPAIVWLSPWLYRNYMIALVLSQVVCTTIAFGLYKLLVFRTGNGSLLREFYRFVSFYLFNYAANIAALPALVKGLGISPIIAQVGFSLVLIVGSYFWHSHVTFKVGVEKPGVGV